MSFIGDVGQVMTGLMETVLHNALGFGFLFVLVFIAYIYLRKPQEENMQKEVFEKNWDTAAQKMKLPYNKKLAICTYPMTTAELKEVPVHQLNYTIQGDIIGMNMIGSDTAQTEFIKYLQTLKSEDLKKVMEKNKNEVLMENFWFVLAYSYKTKGLIFPKTKRSLLFVKPEQIININSNDNIVRVRGIGLHPIGEYEMITDENEFRNKNQLWQDTITQIETEVSINVYSHLGTIITESMKSDHMFRKNTTVKALEINTGGKDDSEND